MAYVSTRRPGGAGVFFDNGPFAHEQAFFDKLYNYSQKQSQREVWFNPGRSSTAEHYLSTMKNARLMGFAQATSAHSPTAVYICGELFFVHETLQ